MMLSNRLTPRKHQDVTIGGTGTGTASPAHSLW